jgi:hypothetical protein
MSDQQIAELDPAVRRFLKPMELVSLGFGEPKTIYAAIKRGEIPVVRVGRKMLVPTSWICQAMALDTTIPVDDPKVATPSKAASTIEEQIYDIPGILTEEADVIVAGLGAARMSIRRRMSDRYACEDEAPSGRVRRYRPTLELLERVLKLYDDGGIEAVQKDTNYSASYCFKLLRKARNEVGQQ